MMRSVKAACDRALGLTHKVEWIGPLIVRLTLGLVFVTTGWGKLHSLDNVTQFFDSLDIPAPHANAVFVSSVEFIGGLLLIAGLGTRIVALFLIGVMAVAIGTAKLPELHGITDLAATAEFAYLATFVWLAVSGAGKASIDYFVGRAMSESAAEHAA